MTCATAAGQTGQMLRDRPPVPRVTDAKVALSERQQRRRRWYFALMGTCLLLLVLAWNLVRFWSVPAAVAMSAVAAVLAPVAALVANWRAGG